MKLFQSKGNRDIHEIVPGHVIHSPKVLLRKKAYIHIHFLHYVQIKCFALYLIS